MHEFSIVRGMIEEVMRIAGENNARKVTGISLRIGRKAGIVKDSLMLAFATARLEYPILSSAEIAIEEVPLRYRCNDCGDTFETDDVYLPNCPQCRSHGLKLISGDELDIARLEMET